MCAAAAGLMVRCEFSCSSRTVASRFLRASAAPTVVRAWMNEHKGKVFTALENEHEGNGSCALVEGEVPRSGSNMGMGGSREEKGGHL